ncbi:carbohydrate ABC transporter permease [Vallitalea guaymasensis]|uniref:carbohydrate ABC transporter permease n=1 Tax=Vallitalea guaymasensis TaxID=1185412 RepID=UPI000DE3CDEA|nr:carbohydrate ABC transporter permease [Vallitalea guaymasensis]
MKKRKNWIVHLFLANLAILCVLPLLLIISISLSSMDSIFNEGYKFLPRGLNFDAYKFILRDSKQIFDSYWVSIKLTFIGTLVSLILTAAIAYPLSRNDFKYQKLFMFFVFFTMLFNGGLVPWYMLITNGLHLKDTLSVLILPYLLNAWYVILMRTYFKSIPYSLIEAAKIDGSSEIYTFIKIILPMSKPALATVGLLTMLRYWNDWWLGMLFVESDNLVPLQYLMHRIMSNLEELQKEVSLYASSMENFPSEPARMAMAIIAAGPMLFIFPFFQKYLVKGMTVGSVKG